MVANDFAAAFRRRFPDLVGRPILVALSGGADSVALLCLLCDAAATLGVSVSAAHVHHHLRATDADADAEFCGELCRTLGVPLAVEHLEAARARGWSPEARWRRDRYRALEVARLRFGSAAVATAHTRDDQAETVLLKLLRGAGPRGVAGIRRRAGTVVRPLLDVARAELRAYLAVRGVGWREDATNAETTLPRGRVRHGLLPAMEAAFRGCGAHLAAFASALADDDELLGTLLHERGVWPAVGRPVPAAAVAGLPAALRHRWVLELAARLPLGEPPSRRQQDAVVAMLDRGRPAAVDLGRRWVLRRRGDQLALSPPPVEPFAARPAVVPSRVELAGGFVGRLGDGQSGDAPHRARLHPRASECPLAWRSVAPGERLGRALAARRLAAARVPAQWRRAWPVLEAGGTMIWLPAVGVAEGWEWDGADGVLAGLEEPWERLDR